MSSGPNSRSLSKSLIGYLRRSLAGEVRSDAGSRAIYSTDASNYRQVPLAVVIPRTIDDVERTIALCREEGVPILNRGGGTSTAGQSCNVAVILDMSKYLNRILAVDPENRVARVEPGVVLDDLRDQAELHGLTFGPDPATHAHCTLGGMIGNNACGVHSIMSGTTEYNVEELDILTYDGIRLQVGATSEKELESILKSGGRRGEIYAGLKSIRDRYAPLIRERYPAIPRRVSGFNLNQLLPESGFNVARSLVGTEGTCVTILEAKLRLIPSPPCRVLLVIGYPDAFEAADHVPEVLEAGPIGLEGFDSNLIDTLHRRYMLEGNTALLPPAGGWLLAEFGDDSVDHAVARARALMQRLKGRLNAPSLKLFTDPNEQKSIWKVREAGLAATAHWGGRNQTWEGWEDAAVAPEQLGGYLRGLRKLMDQYGYWGAFYGHFGEGCVHNRMDFDLTTAPGIAKWRRFLDDAADLVLSFGGSLSGEHGDGQARATLLPRMYGEELVQAFGEFKSLWDPDGRMNPGKVVEPYAPDTNLRLGPEYNPPETKTYFSFADDGGSFANAALRCVGVGACRDTHAGTMCPSYMATREEQHSTRGRARLLFEMLQGDPIQGGWRDPNVKEALDLCLACKACKTECPLQVDMASYKAEFRAHYYAGRLRPPRAYVMGYLDKLSRLAEFAPAIANTFTQVPLLRKFTSTLIGLDARRSLPRYARRCFRKRFSARPVTQGSGLEVLLWPDTFNNYFSPQVLEAAVTVLEEAGYRVRLPPRPLCCGRVLYDFGFLGAARRRLETILETLRSSIRAGVPIVGLEPSCMAVFRDELPNMLPHSEDARRLQQQSYLLSDFLAMHDLDFLPSGVSGRALIHGHCHQKALFGMDGTRTLMERLGVNYELPDTGCCGQAGTFGYEYYELSQQIGERVLLPAVRDTGRDTWIVADGFSCRDQIRSMTGREAVHSSELIAHYISCQVDKGT